MKNQHYYINLAAGSNIEDINSFMKIDTIKSSYEPDKFNLVLEHIRNSIRSCYLQIPNLLVNDKEGGVFGNSGEAFKQAKILYNEQTEFIRYETEDLFKKLFGVDFKIIPLISEEPLIEGITNNLTEENIQDDNL